MTSGALSVLVASSESGGGLIHIESEFLLAATIPIFTGAIGWLINWSGVLMLFNPIHFHGWRIPGLQKLSRMLPRKIQEIPGIMQGGVGWQGIVPARAAKMGSIAVDKGIAKIGSPADFYQELEPDKIAEHVLSVAKDDIRDLVEEILSREQPELWNNLPPRARDAVHSRVQEQLPEIIRGLTDEIGTYIDQLLDVKLMVIAHLEQNPALVNRIFQGVAKRELRQMINFGFLFGFLFGIPVAYLTYLYPKWWLLPLLGIFVGWATNLLGMQLLFEPVEAKKIGPFKLHGLFLRRQPEVSEEYARIIADDVVTLEQIGDHLLHGPRSDRTRQMLETAMRPAVDRASGPARPAVRVAMGGASYDSFRDTLATEGVDYTLVPFSDPEFNKEQSAKVQKLVAARMKELPSPDFVEMMRAAIKEDEWMLYAHGAMLGVAGGLLHLGIFGV